MKKIALTLFLVLGSLTIQAQEATWQTDMNEAIKISKKTKKPLFLFFTGSDWCGWCMRLQKEVFKTPEFEKWAKKNVVLVELDYPRKTPQIPAIQKQNAELQQTFAVQGYPTVWFVNASKKDGKINLEKLGSTGYLAGGPTTWLTAADQILATNKSTKAKYTTN
ncbi:thioredoxin family protein [Flavobacterium sp.]|uniref:thioredoxin family protein n=1 Tax=Flavobacterium sp. TaxID=239 RepID=UPI0025D60ABE|nr:thioredoxin family protein [Flavobacterium sp.]